MRIANFLFLAVGLLLFGGAGRLVFIEYKNGIELRDQAERQQTRRVVIPAVRGDILDTRGRVLAGTVRRPSVYVDPKLVPDARFAASVVAPIFGLETDSLEKRISEAGSRRFLWVERDITDEQLETFERARQMRGLAPCLVIRDEPRRRYPFGRTASHVLGFVGVDDEGVPDRVGLAGAEQQFDDVLRGEPGSRVVTVDGTSKQHRVLSREEDYTPPCDGATVVLTIDAHVQQCAERHVREAVEEYDAKWGAAVVMDPNSGEVLAMATYPDFDPSAPLPDGLDPESAAFAQAQETLRNRVISDAYEPGSIFKPFVFSLALNDGLIDLERVYQINGPTRRFGRRTIHDTHGYGELRGYQIISKSSNIGMGLIGAACGNERLFKYVRSLGFGRKTGVDLPGEHDGLLNRFERWTDYSTQSVPIGQEIAVTPIQIATAFSVFANGGILYKPRVLRGVLAPNGDVLTDNSAPQPIAQVMDPAIAEKFRMRALVEVVSDEGTGRRAQLPDYQVFGKTGTAQVALPDGRGYESGAFTGSFVCGAPSDRPQVVVLVSLHKPRGKAYYGGTVAAPAAAKIVDDTLKYLGVEPEIRTVEGAAHGGAAR